MIKSHGKRAEELSKKLKKARLPWEKQKVFDEMAEHIKEVERDLNTYSPKVLKEKEVKIPISNYKKLVLDDEPFLDKGLTEPQKYLLIDEGFEKVKISPFGKGGSAYYWVRRRFNESLEHAFFCKLLKELIAPFAEVELFYSVKPDVVFRFKGKNYCFEVETGSMLERHPKELEQRFRGIRKEFDDYYILVLDKHYKKKYARFGKAITRFDIKRVLRHILS